MKKYTIFAFTINGIFMCNEVLTELGDTLLIGKFNNKGAEYVFIKNSKDILLNL